MVILYSLGIWLYGVVVRLVALFNVKAKLFVAGRTDWYQNLKNKIDSNESYIWVHCASLGEFEQGRPVIEKIKSSGTHKVLLTFFSPSGFEVRKNYEGADVISYLPLDTASNAKRFVELVQPKAAIFIKYEFWHFFLNKLKDAKIPVLLVSGIFRTNQIQFKWYGGFFRKALSNIDHYFVQDINSSELLNEIGIDAVTVSGDTRFDRVAQVLSEHKTFPLIDAFVSGHKTIVYGSLWKEDAEILEQTLNSTQGVKHIIAPHEIDEAHLRKIDVLISKSCKRFSTVSTAEDLSDVEVLIIDSIGMLSHLYRYAHIAYVGGAFGKGLHNILEAATFGKPIVFGPNYIKFKEAVDLVKVGGAFSVSDKTEYGKVLQSLMSDTASYQKASFASGEYTKSNQGATKAIVEFMKLKHLI